MRACPAVAQRYGAKSAPTTVLVSGGHHELYTGPRSAAGVVRARRVPLEQRSAQAAFFPTPNHICSPAGARGQVLFLRTTLHARAWFTPGSRTAPSTRTPTDTGERGGGGALTVARGCRLLPRPARGRHSGDCGHPRHGYPTAGDARRPALGAPGESTGWTSWERTRVLFVCYSSAHRRCPHHHNHRATPLFACAASLPTPSVSLRSRRGGLRRRRSSTRSCKPSTSAPRKTAPVPSPSTLT